MTLTLALLGRGSLWLLTDRRLSEQSRTIRDDATKMLVVDTPDGEAMLGYAGLGATAAGTEPSEWMSRVLRGNNYYLEQALGVLTNAMRKQFYPHLSRIPRNFAAQHTVIATAFIGNAPRVYTIDLVLSPDRKKAFYRNTRHEWTYPSGFVAPPKLICGGSGASVLQRETGWTRELRQLLGAHERGLISPFTFADRLAQVNYYVHGKDKFVGPNCVVAWRYCRAIRAAKFNGGFQSYSGIVRDKNTPLIPQVMGGVDMATFAKESLDITMARGEYCGDDLSRSLPTLEESKTLFERATRKADRFFR